MELPDESEHICVIDNLVSMFGHILTREVISTVVESCEGDLNFSVDAIMKLTNEGNIKPEQADEPLTQKDSIPTTQPQQIGTSYTYAGQCAQNRGAIPKKIQQPAAICWTDQIRKIIAHHNEGARVMIFMRGLPGSGKSYLATSLVESMVGVDFKNHIFTTDDYFMFRGRYMYDVSKISQAHSWNKERVKHAVLQGLSPIVVDNTNIEVWEMQPYLINGVSNGYIIEVIEMNTPWAKKASQLFKRNRHGVPFTTIKKKLETYTEGITGKSLIRSFGLSYPSNMVPPVRRLLPLTDKHHKINPVLQNSIKDTSTIKILQPIEPADNNIQIHHLKEVEQSTITHLEPLPSAEEKSAISHLELLPCPVEQDQMTCIVMSEDIELLTQEEQVKQKIVLEAQQKLEEIEKFEVEWENGEKWEDNDQSAISALGKDSTTVIRTEGNSTADNIVTSPCSLLINLESKPPRKINNIANLGGQPKNLMQSVIDCQDWRNIFVPPWVVSEEQLDITSEEQVPIETLNSSTCIEISDTDLSGKHKIIIATPRNINEFYVAPEREKIPEKRMFDKSSMTNEGMLMSFHCPQKEKHFILFRKLFMHIERESLRDIFDTCYGDPNWAVESILGGGVKYTLKTTQDQNESDLDEESDSSQGLTCTCLANYDIIPDMNKSDALEVMPMREKTLRIPTNPSVHPEKKKRDVIFSDDNIKLKRQIEQNIVIPDSHYSDHCLKIRKIRRGELNTDLNVTEQPSTSESSAFESRNAMAPIGDASDEDDDNEGDYSYLTDRDADKIISVNVGRTFINQLDEMFDRKDMEYPDNIAFNISIPNSLLNELNALWMESIMFQLDEFAKNSEEMIKKDEEFARQIALKEEELMLQGKEPNVPDLKEIMDLELAISIHQKDMSEWRNKIPTDLAAKMTHDKLFNLFPEIEKDTLLEMLMAHDNNFKATVEVLLMSMGRNDLLENENGVNKFIVEKELQRQEKMLEEQRKALLELEWPPVHQDEVMNMDIVKGYRNEATEHLNFRNMHKQKAEEFIRRGMPQVATYYSDIANYHKLRQEQSNSMAVASLMQYHSQNKNSDTVDLHYFRVPEAKEAMDLFIDTHIHKLRQQNKSEITLFFITGRGLHSHGGPRVKPACAKRLRERGLHYSESNPGLLRARVSSTDKLTYQVNQET